MSEPFITFIVGAGASVPYGLPTGPRLTQFAAQYLRKNQKTRRDDFTKMEFDQNGFEKAAKMLDRSRTPTIDHFVGQNPSLGEPLRASIAGAIWELEEQAMEPKEQPVDDWIAWLFHNNMKSRPEDFAKNPHVFITFNYDRLPQLLMATMMANTYDIDAEKSLEICCDASSLPYTDLTSRFIHVHGAVSAPMRHKTRDHGRHTDSRMLTNRFSETRAGNPPREGMLHENILTIHDDSEGHDNQQQLILNILWNSSKVIFLGFGYHEPNLRKLGLGSQQIEEMSSHRLFAGTGYQVEGFAREQLTNRLGPHFSLGDSDERCIEFLSRTLTEDRPVGIREIE